MDTKNIERSEINRLDTVFFTELMKISEKGIISFHALPIHNIEVLKNSRFYAKYIKLLTKRNSCELTVTSPFLDSLARPSASLSSAQEMTAKVFGADQTLFITGGSTLSNQIAIKACCNKASRILMQRGLHQSFHFSKSAMNYKATYIDDEVIRSDIEASSLNFSLMVKALKKAEDGGDPFTVVVINSQTYEGIIHRLDDILPELVRAGPSIETLIIDEAWGAWSYFDEEIRRHTAIDSGRKIFDKYKVNIVITHSAHKSLFALRQASYLHCIGDKKFQDTLRHYRYRLHTSSPSYALLASLDLASIVMEEEGIRLINRSRKNSSLLREGILNKLKEFEILELPKDKCKEMRSMSDPTKVWIGTGNTGLSGKTLRDLLFNKYQIYTNRYTDRAILINIHIGITENNIEALLQVLKEIEKSYSCQRDFNFKKNEVSTSFVIPYPPGVPVIIPGEKISEDTIQKLSSIRDSGMDIISIEQ